MQHEGCGRRIVKCLSEVKINNLGSYLGRQNEVMIMKI